ncbi:membrane protein YczE [Alysiella filiformis]|uniref:Uncharacterized membrane protein YczE n=1 Tax=Alysiella filiformis DSM 16848 TaxID=1120981 RepID=A0A286E1R5_9NEIS|nr:hypothetical protein [Alysiella filiformis]QMT30790.1 YitT family protein [Alysiella filiformis]UBQ56228.1 YitT family protein [Alysiella filiformis DSM 16848]SOD64847.1 Uncharacterized membrane protein YczE [Alysiella filiformis DSM 16848]
MSKTNRILPDTPWKAQSVWSLERKSLIMLLFGLAWFWVGEAMLVLANLGATPWAVFAQGLAQQFDVNIGVTTFLISVGVMLLWMPLHLRVGLGTLANMVVIALVFGLVVKFVPAPSAESWFLRGILCVGGVVVIGVAATLYLTCHMGAGPRDGLMVGLCHKTGWRVGVVRTLLESTVCGVGWLFGGTVGLGTLLFAFGVGWVVQFCLLFLERWFAK